MLIKYVGPHPEVVVDEFNYDTVIVNGEPIDIPDDLAARLLEQDTWQDANPSTDTTTDTTTDTAQTPAQDVTATTPTDGTPVTIVTDVTDTTTGSSN